MIDKRRYDLVVFDWDGTLMDSESQIVGCMHLAVADLGLEPVSDDAVRNIIGLGLREAIDTLIPGRDSDFHQAFVDRYRQHWFASDGSMLFEGVAETLAVLQEQNYLMGVATGKGRRGLDKVLKETGLGDFFAATRCADETLSKPNPQMLQEIMAELGVAPASTLLVGDTEWDLEMGRRAGAATVAVSHGVHDNARLEACGPIAMIHRIPELLVLLGEIDADGRGPAG